MEVSQGPEPLLSPEGSQYMGTSHHHSHKTSRPQSRDGPEQGKSEDFHGPACCHKLCPTVCIPSSHENGLPCAESNPRACPGVAQAALRCLKYPDQSHAEDANTNGNQVLHDGSSAFVHTPTLPLQSQRTQPLCLVQGAVRAHVFSSPQGSQGPGLYPRSPESTRQGQQFS